MSSDRDVYEMCMRSDREMIRLCVVISIDNWSSIRVQLELNMSSI